MTATEVESKIMAMEKEIARLKERLERSEIDAAIRRSDEQFARGEGIPARQALESLRKKYNIPCR